MILFLFIAVLGLVVSLVAHFGLLFGVLDDLPTLLIVVLNAGVLILAGFICGSSTMLDHRFDKAFRKKAYTAACPHWIMVTTGFMLLYSIALVAYFCIAAHFITSQISFLELTMDKLDRGLTTLDVGAYATAIPMYYYYNYLWKNRVRHCNNGHFVGCSEKYCDICGDKLE